MGDQKQDAVTIATVTIPEGTLGVDGKVTMKVDLSKTNQVLQTTVDENGDVLAEPQESGSRGEPR